MTRPLPELLASWEAAETRLYPVVLTRPEVYERSLAVVHEVVVELAVYGTPAGLAEAFDRVGDIAARAIERSGVSTAGVDVGLAAAAAFALRYRVVLAASARAEALARIQAARARQPTWVIVVENGDPEGGPYHRLDMHLPDGGCVRRSVDLDAETGAPVFGLEAFVADPTTGDRLTEAAALEAPASYRTRAEWEAAIARVTRLVEERRG